MLCMDRKPIVTLSNSLQTLLSTLRDDLFSLPQKPFEKKMIVLPDLSLKNLLMQTFVSDKQVQVVMGVDFVEFGAAIQRLCEWCMDKKLFFPSLDLLTLQLETILDTPNLAPNLAVEFLRYGTFGGPFLKKWPSSWQQTIWNQVFSKWNYPYQILEAPLKDPKINASLYLFNFSFLPKLYHLFFERISPYFSIRYYQFCPCAQFWSDSVTDFEKLSLLKKNPHVSVYLEEGNRFLANFGKMGRENMRVLEEEDFIFEERFKPPSQGTHLATFQREILEFKQPHDLKERVKDTSILLLPASSKLREVEILYAKLLEMDVSPLDIHVFAPDISMYSPLVEFVFGAEDSPYAYTLYDPLPNPFLKTVMQLLALDRFEPESVFLLLSSPHFSPLTQHEVRAFESWITESGVKWGIDKSHRESLLPNLLDKTDHGTWQKAFDTLLDNLIIIPPKPTDWDLPYLNFSEGETLGKGIWIIHSLRKDLDFLKSTLLTGAEWIETVDRLCHRYLKCEEEEETLLKKMLSPLKEIESPFALPSFQKYLSRFLKQKRRAQGPLNLRSISFRSLRPGVIVSSKIIALLGMQEETFPRSHVPSSLNLLGRESDYCPVSPDEDRFLFLQAVMSAEEAVWITYQNVSEEDGKEQFPSLIVQELNPKVETHPPFPFHSDYFSSPRPYSLRHYQIAQSVYYPEKKKPFIGEYLYQGPLPIEATQTRPSLQTLERFAKHPIRFYFQEILGMYFHQDRSAQEEFFLSSLQKYKLLQKKTSLEDADRLGRLPLGRFKEVAKRKVEREWQNLPLIETTPYFLNTFQETVWIAKEGFPFLGKPTFEELIHIYPLYLAVCAETPLPLLPLMGKSPLHLKRDPQNALSDYLEYYQIACNTPSPLLSLFAVPLLKKDANAFANRLKHLPRDPYCHFLFRDPSQYHPHVIFENWAPLIRKTFAPLLEMLS